ncbi:hypothetical protein ACLBX9_28980 [Methylobacterium sp. A49B]|uniref:hypothetical protein n=1 Tax=Methylobacterium mesophilicum TaxID=39956 RepID=UPI0002C60D9E|nr:hypothetical protein [Methylobacterium mesophilicum]MBE7248102.1 hypothetical protein [Actinomycetospora chiangmaiensis]
MERLLIVLAILIFAVAVVSVVSMVTRSRRAPLRLETELDVEHEDLVLGSVGTRRSPIDRSAQVLDPHVLDLEANELEPIRKLGRADRGEASRRDRTEAGQ